MKREFNPVPGFVVLFSLIIIVINVFVCLFVSYLLGVAGLLFGFTVLIAAILWHLFVDGGES